MRGTSPARRSRGRDPLVIGPRKAVGKPAVMCFDRSEGNTLRTTLTTDRVRVINLHMATNNDDTYTRYETTIHRVGMLLDMVTRSASDNVIRSQHQKNRCGEVSEANELELLHLMAMAGELSALLPAEVRETMGRGFTYQQATTLEAA